ncbi:hypothetical protein D3C80_1709280 [compost metagenome]
MYVSQCSGQLAVTLFGPWGIQIAGAQPRFNMANRYLVVVGSQGRSKSSCRIAMHQEHIGLEILEYAFHTLQYRSAYIR